MKPFFAALTFFAFVSQPSLCEQLGSDLSEVDASLLEDFTSGVDQTIVQALGDLGPVSVEHDNEFEQADSADRSADSDPSDYDESDPLSIWCASTRYPDESCLLPSELEIKTKSMWPPMTGNLGFIYYGTLVPQYDRVVRANSLLVEEMNSHFPGYKAAVVRETIDSFMRGIYVEKKVYQFFDSTCGFSPLITVVFHLCFH